MAHRLGGAMISLWIGWALARDFSVKVHDRDGTLGEGITVSLNVSGKTYNFTPKDDGNDPDKVAGDHLFTAAATEIAGDSGMLTVQSGKQTWQGEFLFESGSDPVLLIGLEVGGRAAASTHEVMFMPDQQAGMPGPPPGGSGGPPPMQGSAIPGGVPGGVPGGIPGGVPGGPQPGGMAAPMATKAHGTPKGLWMGFGVLGAALAGIGALAVFSARQKPRLPGLSQPLRPTTAKRGAFIEAEGKDLWVGAAPAGALALSPGPWSPEEIALGALAAAPVRVVVGEAAQVRGSYEALAEVLAGRADLLWIEGK